MMLSLGLVVGCGSSGGDTSGASAGSTGGSSETGAPTTDVPTGDVSATTGEPGTGSISGTDSVSTTSEPSSATDSETQAVDPSTGPGTSDGTTSIGGTTSGTTTTDGSSTSDGTSEGSSSTGGPDCVPTEMTEVTCDQIDNDCDGNVDNIDAGGDGICDCLNIGILGNAGFAPNANFEAWLEQQGSSVTRTLLLNNPGVVTPALLDQFDLVLIDRIERALSAEEAAAIEAFVKDDGRGMITLIGYNFDNNNPVPERDRANTVLTPFGLAYEGGYFGNGVTPTFDQNHPISKDIFDVNFAGGIKPVDNGNQGASAVFATVQGQTAGIAHETDMGGRIIVWGDEWITFDSDWQGFADVQAFWVNMVGWAKPQDFCGSPQ